MFKKIIIIVMSLLTLNFSTISVIRIAIVPTVALVMTQKTLEANENQQNIQIKDKSRFLAILLCIVGLEHLYLNNYGTFVIHLITYAAGGIGFIISLIDAITFIKMNDKEWQEYLQSDKGFPWL